MRRTRWPRNQELPMKNVTYNDLVTRYGSPAAYDLLLSVEKLAQIRNEIIHCDEEARFRRALDALNDIDFAETEAPQPVSTIEQ
jgi:hypothetical protein